MLQKVKDQFNSVDASSLKKSISGYLGDSPSNQLQGDMSDVDSVSSEKTPSITELSETSDPDLSRGKPRSRRSGAEKEYESRLLEQVKLKNRLADMLEQQQDKSKAENREIRRSFELKLQEQHANLSEDINKKGKLLEKSKVVIQELDKNVQKLQRGNEMESVQHALELEKKDREANELRAKIKEIENERQQIRTQLETTVTQHESMSNQMKAMKEANANQSSELTRLHDVMQNSTDKGGESENRWQQLLEQITRERDESKQECVSLQKREEEARKELSERSRSLESTVQSLETELSKCGTTIGKLEAERDRISHELNSQVSALNREVSEGKERLKKREEESREEISVVEKTVVEIKQLLQVKEQEIVRMSGEGERQKLQISKLQKDNERNLQEFKSSLQEEKVDGDELRTLIEQVKLEKAQELESLYSTHDEEKQVLIDQNSDLKKQLTDTTDQLAGVTSSSMSTQQKHRTEMVKLGKEKAGLEEQVLKAKSERAELQQKCLEMEKALKQHKTGEEGYKTQFEEVRVRYDNLQGQYSRDVERLEMRVELLNEQLTVCKRDGQDREVDLQTQLTLSRQQKEQERLEMSQSAEGLNNQITILDQTVVSISDRCEQLTTQLEEEKGMRKQVEDSLQDEIERLGFQLREREEKVSQASSAKDDVQRQLDTAKQMIADKNDNLKIALQEKSTLYAGREELERKLKESVAQCEDLSRLRDQMNREMGTFQSQLQSLLSSLLEGTEGLRGQMSDRISGVSLKLSGLEGVVEKLGHVREDNGSLTNELMRLQAENSDHLEKLQKKSLEIKQLQQRQTDLKKVISRELKMQSSQSELSFQEEQLVASTEDNSATDSTPLLPTDYVPHNSGIMQLNDNEQLNSAILPFQPGLRSNSMLTLPSLSLSRNPEDLIDLTLSSPIGEINFQYLRNIMLQYMCSNPSEAKQLHKALFTLLNASSREQAAVNQFWNYRESWFGFKVPPKFRSIVAQSNEL